MTKREAEMIAIIAAKRECINYQPDHACEVPLPVRGNRSAISDARSWLASCSPLTSPLITLDTAKRAKRGFASRAN